MLYQLLLSLSLLSRSIVFENGFKTDHYGLMAMEKGGNCACQVSDTLNFDTVSYRLGRDSSGYFLVHVPSGHVLPINTALLRQELPETEDEDMEALMNYNGSVTAFSIGAQFVGIHLSSYDIGGGSMGASRGFDTFLTLDTVAQAFLPQPLQFGISKGRHRAMGFVNAHFTHFLINHFSEEKYVSLGAFQERVYAKYDEDDGTPSGPYHETTAVRWFVFDGKRWNYAEKYEKRLFLGVELPLIGLVMSPVEYAKEMYRKRESRH